MAQDISQRLLQLKQSIKTLELARAKAEAAEENAQAELEKFGATTIEEGEELVRKKEVELKGLEQDEVAKMRAIETRHQALLALAGSLR